MDWDNKIAFWIKGVPYLWVDNKDWKKCKRIYLVSPKTRAFDIEGKSKTLQTFWEERTPFYMAFLLLRIAKREFQIIFWPLSLP